MAADDGLAFLIEVAVDSSAVAPGLREASSQVEATVAQINARLAQLGDVEILKGLATGVDASKLSLEQVAQAARDTIQVLNLLSEAQGKLGTGVSLTAGGQSVEELQRQAILLNELRRSGVDSLSSAERAAFNYADGLRAAANASQELLDRQLEQARVAREFNPSGLPDGVGADNELLARNAELQERIAQIIESRAGATAAETAALIQQDLVQARIAERAARVTEVPASQALGFARSQVTADAATERQALLSSQLVPTEQALNAVRAATAGLTEKQIAALLAVAQAQEKVEVATQREVISRTEAIRLIQQETAAATRLASASASGGGGGGFFGGLQSGLGFGHEDRPGSQEAGFQLGQLARYVVYYQAFRDIEQALKDSISETIAFERGVTNLSLQLGVSRDNARSLATELGNAVSVAGLAPSAGAALGTQFQGAFALNNPTGISNADLARQGADVGAQLAVVSGSKDVAKNMQDATAATQGFGLAATDVNRVLDAAATASQHFLGGLDPSKVLPGLASVADLAQQTGISLETAANLLAAVQARTGEDSQAAAGELRRILGREGQPALQAVFAQNGINTAQSFGDELTQLSEKWDTLSRAEQRSILTQLGGSGGRSAAAAAVIVSGYKGVLDQANQSVQQGGAFTDAYNARLNDLQGTLRTISGDFKNLAKDVGESGLFDALGLALKAVDPLVSGLDKLIQLFDTATGGAGRFAVSLTELTVVATGLGRLGLLGERAFGIATTNSVLTAIPGVNRIDRIRGGEDAAGEAGAATGVRTEIEAAGAEGAAAIKAAAAQLAAALDELSAGLKGGAAEVSAGGTQIAEAEVQVAEQMRLAQGFSFTGGRLRGPGGRFASQAQNEAALAEEEAAGAGAGAASGAAIPVLGLAIGGIIAASIAANVYTEIQKQSKAAASAYAVAAPTATATVDQLNSVADAARSAATAARGSSGGIIGSTTNFFRGDATGNAARAADQLAALTTAEAQRLSDAQTRAAAGTQTSVIDLTSATGVTEAFKVMDAQGATATQKLNALNTALGEFAKASEGGARGLAAAQSGVLAQGAANTTSNLLQAQGAQAFRRLQSGATGLDDNNNPTDARVNLHAIDFEALNKAQSDAVNAFLARNLPKGGDITPAITSGMIDAEVRATNDALSKAGVSKDEIAKLQEDIRKAAQQGIATQTASLLGTKGVKLDAGPLGDAVKNAVGELAKASSDAQIAAAVGQGPAGASVGLAGAQAALQQARTALANARAASKGDAASAEALIPLQQAVNQYTAQVATAKVAQIQATAQLAAAQFPHDKEAQLQIQLQGLQAALAATTKPDEIAQLGLAIANAENQAADQALADAIAVNDAVAQVGNATAQAEAKLKDALLTLNALGAGAGTGRGVHGQQSQETPEQILAGLDAIQKSNAVQDAKLQAQQAAQLAGIDPRDTIKTDQTTISQTQAKLAELQSTGRKGNDEYRTLQAQLTTEQRKLVSDRADLAISAVAAGAGTGTTDQAAARVREAQIALTKEIPGTKGYNDALASLHQAQGALAKAAGGGGKNDPFNAQLELGIDPRDTLALAAAKLQEDAHAAATATDAAGRAQAQLASLQDEVRLQQAQAAQDEAQRSAQVRQGNPISVALANLANARQQLALDLRGTQQYWQDYGALQAAKAALAQANLDQSTIVDQLRSDTTDPVAQARNAVIEARRKLNADKRDHTGNLQQDQLTLEQAQQAEQRAAFDQQLSDQQTAYQLHEESTAQYSQFLHQQDESLRKQLAALKKGSEGYRQKLDELNQIDQAIDALNNQLSGQFNLGDIKLPTVYEVRRQVAAGASGANVVQQNNYTTTTINGADFAAVVRYINQILGQRGGSTVATTGRKAA